MREYEGPHNVIIDKRGLASITKRNMHVLKLNYGDLFYWGINKADSEWENRELLFIKVDPDDHIGDASALIRYNKYQKRGAFYLLPILRLLDISPPFVCKVRTANDLCHFSLIVPEYKTFDIRRIKDKDLIPIEKVKRK